MESTCSKSQEQSPQSSGDTSTSPNHLGLDPASTEDQCWVGLQKYQNLHHANWVEQHCLPGNTREKIEALGRWHNGKLGRTQKFFVFLLCQKPYVGLATLGRAEATLEAQSFHQTTFEDIVKIQMLTDGLSRPHTLVDAEDYLGRNNTPSIRVDSNAIAGTNQQRHVLYVGLETSRTRIALVFVAWAVLCVVLGIVVGAETDAGSGAAVGSSALAFVCILQGALILIYRQS